MTQTVQHYHIFATEAGFCGIAWNATGISRFQLPGRNAAATQQHLLRRRQGAEPAPPTETVLEAISAVKRYFAGEAIDFSDLTLDLGDQTAFFQRIYTSLRGVGWGQTTTYGALAKTLGAEPQAARDVGQAMATNPVPLIIPCHRVLAAGGKISGFSAPGGAATKRRMLELEGVNVGLPKTPQQSLNL